MLKSNSELAREIFDILRGRDPTPARQLIYARYSKHRFADLDYGQLVDAIPRIEELYGEKNKTKLSEMGEGK